MAQLPDFRQKSAQEKNGKKKNWNRNSPAWDQRGAEQKCFGRNGNLDYKKGQQSVRKKIIEGPIKCLRDERSSQHQGPTCQGMTGYLPYYASSGRRLGPNNDDIRAARPRTPRR